MLHLAVASHLLCQPAMNTKSSGVINTPEGRVKKKKMPTNNVKIANFLSRKIISVQLNFNIQLHTFIEAQKYDKMYTYRHRVVTKSFLINTFAELFGKSHRIRSQRLDSHLLITTGALLIDSRNLLMEISLKPILPF